MNTRSGLKFITVLAIYSLFQVVGFAQNKKLDPGVFVGYEKMPNITPDNKNAQWFHENTLKIINGKVTLEKSPIIIKNGEKNYSASDGGFFTYEGKLIVEKEKYFVELRLVHSEYVLLVNPTHNSTIRYEVVTDSDGSLLIDGVVYRSL